MSSIYMKLEGLDSIPGAATLPEVGGKKGLMAVSNFEWSGSRPVSMVIGSATNAEVGGIALRNVDITRESDGASPFLQTFLFQPDAEGRTIDILITKADRKGKGSIPSLIVTLEEARMTNYSLSASDQPFESFSLAYTKISIVQYLEETNGEVKKGDTVKFDLTTNTLVSAAKLP